MSLINLPSCDLCGGICGNLTEAYDIDIQEDMMVCEDCLSRFPDLVTNARLQWGPVVQLENK